MNATGTKCRVFLCHASEDKATVRKLCDGLRAAGFEPWLDEKALWPGQNWRVSIEAAVRRADAVVVCISHSSVTKIGFVQREVKYAMEIADERPPQVGFIFPVLLDNSEIPARFAHIQVARLTTTDGYDRLLTALKIHATALGRTVAPDLSDRTRDLVGNLTDFFEGIDKGGRLDLEVAVKQGGMVVLFHSHPLKVGLKRIEFFSKERDFVFLSHEGWRRSIGLPLKEDVSTHLYSAKEILMVWLNHDLEPLQEVSVSLVVYRS